MAENIVVFTYIFIALFVVFLPTLVAIRNGGNWFVILIGNLFLPLSGVGWIALLYLALRRRRR